MTRYAALLRGINVGGNNKIPMAELRQLFADLGYTDVATILQSGNAVFDAGSAKPAAVEKAIEQALLATYGATIRVLVRSAKQIADVIAADPLAAVAKNPSRYIVTFLGAAPAAGIFDGINPDDYAPETFTVIGREMYSWYPGGQADTPLGKALSKALGTSLTTARNWNTVAKLHARLSG